MYPTSLPAVVLFKGGVVTMVVETILGLAAFLFFLFIAVWLLVWCNKGQDKKGFPHSRGRDN